MSWIRNRDSLHTPEAERVHAAWIVHDRSNESNLSPCNEETVRSGRFTSVSRHILVKKMVTYSLRAEVSK
jgi:hypothetical protein